MKQLKRNYISYGQLVAVQGNNVSAKSFSSESLNTFQGNIFNTILRSAIRMETQQLFHTL